MQHVYVDVLLYVGLSSQCRPVVIYNHVHACSMKHPDLGPQPLFTYRDKQTGFITNIQQNSFYSTVVLF